MTASQILAGTKTITRRFGWWKLQPGDDLWAVEKSMGLKKGEKVKKLRKIRIMVVGLEPLNAITADDCAREGFPEMSPPDFVAMLCRHYKCQPDKIVNRIEFYYL